MPDLPTGRIEKVQHRREGDDEQNRLESLEERLHAHARDAHGDHERQNKQPVGKIALRRKKCHDVEHCDKELGARVELMGERVAGEILSKRDVLQHFLPPPLLSAMSSLLSSSTV